MAEQNDDLDTDSRSELGSGRKRNMGGMIAIVVLAAVICAAAGVFLFLNKGGTKEFAAEEKNVVVVYPGYYPLDDMLVNLSGDAKRPNYLKLKIVIELADEKDKVYMDAIKPKIIDKFQAYLRELRVDDLKGSVGTYRLREELLIRVAEVSKPVRIRDILFQEMLVQ
ncbi:MAG: flagellar basal body-associated FliL family protein [Alphaproteobacteria bacterium]|nr:flagellar basal body-associated FliL family protein [Alphaproteobacteria bacterium]MCL2505656.1 flagellar basal body-associated FliL family protein [Alphaproteobacteria bacterium]